MSTIISTHPRFANPVALAFAAVILAGGVAVIGVTAAEHDPTAPNAPTAPAQVAPNPSRVGLGDFTASNQGSEHHTPPLKGGHTTVGVD
jgi:hypothetical protein